MMMDGWVMPKDMTTGQAMCIAEVRYEQRTIKVKNLIWVNHDLDYIKRGWEMLGERGLIVDMENNYYNEGDVYTAQGLVYDIFESGLIK